MEENIRLLLLTSLNGLLGAYLYFLVLWFVLCLVFKLVRNKISPYVPIKLLPVFNFIKNNKEPFIGGGF
jgi:hypothetical protein